MAVAVQVAGACPVLIGTEGASIGSMNTLGYTRNSADVTKEAFWLDVAGDENGGDDGPPIEIQYLGEIARIRLELTKFDPTYADEVRARLAGGTAGTLGTVGTLMFSSTSCMRLLLNAPNDPRNFPRCFPRQAIEIGRGTKYSTFICEFEAHALSGVLYNAVTT